MTITTLDGLIGGVKSSSMIWKNASKPAVAAGFWADFWAAGAIPAAGTAAFATTSAGTVNNEGTTGAAAYMDPASGYNYLLGADISSTVSGIVLVYDRIWGWGTSTFVNGTYSTNPPNQSSDVYRPSTGEGIEYWASVTTVMSATAHTLTATYTDQSGNTGHSATVTLPASAPVARAYPLTRAAGDYGAQRLTALAGSSVPTGAFNIMAIRKILSVGVVANVPRRLTAIDLGLKPLEANACLGVMFYNPTGTTAPDIMLSLDFAAG